MNHNNYRFPSVTGEIRAYWLEGKTGGQVLVGAWGHYNQWYYNENIEIIHHIMSANAYIDFEINEN